MIMQNDTNTMDLADTIRMTLDNRHIRITDVKFLESGMTVEDIGHAYNKIKDFARSKFTGKHLRLENQPP